ncbi:MAG: diacylglycerol kinase family protein, partial [Clostridia bacterium]|nr:diacylglycerol kinase family protein [Clostridia bacterium]
MTGYILYNPLAGDGSVLWMDAVEFLLSDEIRRVDITKIKDYKAFFQGMARDDYVILSGGDGTLNRFVNATREIEIEQEILYFPNGTGNDFARDLGKPKESGPFPITEYLKDLPTVTVQKKEYRFVNGVGFGIDGYCCEKGEALRQKGKKRVSYPAIAVRGLLGGFRPVTARVTVDGVSRVFTGVW